MATGFKVGQIGNYAVDVDDILMRREYFNEGNMWTWGWNATGQLGNNTTVNRSTPADAQRGIDWKSVSAGYLYSAGVKTNGTLWTWGQNTYGKLGANSTIDRSSPATVTSGSGNWKQISCGYNHMGSIQVDGSLWTWGRSQYGQLGDNSTINKSSPVTVSGGGTNWRQIACGYVHSAAIKTNGSLWVWGRNSGGILGDNSTIDRSSPVQVSGGGTDWKQVTCGKAHTAGIKANGTLWTWGQNGSVQLGTGVLGDRSSPGTIAGGGTNWKSVSADSQVFNAAIKTDGTLWTWGTNTNGNLANNSTANQSSPVTTAGGGTDWKIVKVGDFFAAAIKANGTLWTWGGNTQGKLGTNDTVNRSSPVTTTNTDASWEIVGPGFNHVVALHDNSV